MGPGSVREEGHKKNGPLTSTGPGWMDLMGRKDQMDGDGNVWELKFPKLGWGPGAQD